MMKNRNATALPHGVQIIVWAAGLFLCGCAAVPPPAAPPAAEQPTALPTPPPVGDGKFYLDDGPPPDYSAAQLAAIPDATPRREKIPAGRNRPYTTQWGQHYRPYLEIKPHHERGHASWYGRRYHGRKTASGEIYDMFKMTAAHPILPIPSYARVSRPDNGTSVVVRVNDRGPFLGGRIIDLSFAAAHRLGMAKAGTAEVVVEAIVLSPEIPPAEPPAAETPAATSPPVYLQLGAFAVADNAEKMRRRFVEEGLGAHAHKIESLKGKHVFLVGPYSDRPAARQASAELCARGWCDAWIYAP